MDEPDWREPEVPAAPVAYSDVNDPQPKGLPLWIVLLWLAGGLLLLAGVVVSGVNLLLGGGGALRCGVPLLCVSGVLLVKSLLLTLVVRDQARARSG